MARGLDRCGPDDRLAGDRQPLTSRTLAEFYTRGYAVADRAEAMRLGAWRALGARLKAAHIAALLERAAPRPGAGGADDHGDGRRTPGADRTGRGADGALWPGAVVEIGCGDGALLHALSEAGIGATLDGFELSPTAIELARERAIPRARRLEAYDGATVPADDGAYDLAVLSHVLEHVPRPALLLAEAARMACHVVVEVPLEDNRSARRPAKRAEALRIGHIQRFARADVRSLLCGAGLRPLATLADPLPLEHHAYFAVSRREHAAARARWALRSAAWRLAPRVAERAFTVHFAVLAAAADRG